MEELQPPKDPVDWQVSPTMNYCRRMPFLLTIRITKGCPSKLGDNVYGLRLKYAMQSRAGSVAGVGNVSLQKEKSRIVGERNAIGGLRDSDG